MSRPLISSYVITTVEAPAQSFALTTLEDVKVELSIPASNTSNDAWLNKAIAQVSRSVANYCNRVFGLATYQDLVRPNLGLSQSGVRPNTNPILLARWPVATVSSVSEVVAQVSTVLTSGTDYEVDLSTGELYRLDREGNPREWRADSITIAYQAGWVLPEDEGETTMPDDLEMAVLRIITARFQDRQRDPYLKSESEPMIGDKTYWVGTLPGREGQFPSDVAGILDNYRVPVTA